MKPETNKEAGQTFLSVRSREFALRIIRLYSSLSSGTLEQCIGKQLLRSGTSVGAQLREGQRGRSIAEVISKTESATQELEETAYWIDLLERSGIIPSARLEALKRETDELMAILVSGVKRLKALKSTS